MKLKSLIPEFVVSKEVENFLRQYDAKNPNASVEDISSAILSHLQQQTDMVEETLASNTLKILLPALLAVYGPVVGNSIAKDVHKKIQSHITKPSSKQIAHWISKYSKMYGINEKYILRLARRETGFSSNSKSYNPYQVGDKNNTLGPSYGVCQIKVPTAKEIYELEPEHSINPNSITAKKLTHDVEFNIKTCAKILSTYYKKFKNVKGHTSRIATAATAYNAGITGAKTYGINKYGKTIAGVL